MFLAFFISSFTWPFALVGLCRMPAPPTQPPGHPMPSRKIAVVGAFLRFVQHGSAFPQALRVHDPDLPGGVELLDAVHHGACHAAADREAPPVGAGAGKLIRPGNLGEVYALGLKHTHDLLEGQHKIHIASDVGARLASSFLAEQGPMKTTLQPGCFFLIRRPVRTIGVRAMEIALREIRIELFRHLRPGGAAGGSHKGQLVRHLLHEIMGLLDGTQIRAQSSAASITSSKPRSLKASRTFSGGSSLPHWPRRPAPGPRIPACRS